MKKNPKITLVGAGPGDPELITVKGLKALQSADVVLYDALSNPALLTKFHNTNDVFFSLNIGLMASDKYDVIDA